MSRIPFSKVSSDVTGWTTVWPTSTAKVRTHVKAGITQMWLSRSRTSCVSTGDKASWAPNPTDFTLTARLIFDVNTSRPCLLFDLPSSLGLRHSAAVSTHSCLASVGPGLMLPRTRPPAASSWCIGGSDLLPSSSHYGGAVGGGLSQDSPYSYTWQLYLSSLPLHGSLMWFFHRDADGGSWSPVDVVELPTESQAFFYPLQTVII